MHPQAEMEIRFWPPLALVLSAAVYMHPCNYRLASKAHRHCRNHGQARTPSARRVPQPTRSTTQSTTRPPAVIPRDLLPVVALDVTTTGTGRCSFRAHAVIHVHIAWSARSDSCLTGRYWQFLQSPPMRAVLVAAKVPEPASPSCTTHPTAAAEVKMLQKAPQPVPQYR